MASADPTFIVHLSHLRLRDFRNYARLDVGFDQGFHVLLGNNAQGKTNILESIYLMATLRSFRGVGGAQMIRHQQKGYFIGATVVTDVEHDVKIYWSSSERKIGLNGDPVRRLSDYIGTLRAVVFCSEDLQLVKGTARIRRRFIDLLLSQTQPGYLETLQRYTRAVRSRNAVLKRPKIDPAVLDSFSKEVVELGNQLIDARKKLVPKISPLVRLAYRRISNDAEELHMEYKSSVKDDFSSELAASAERERRYKSTVVGPHRDELDLQLDERAAAKFGSEGQKRSLVVALKMAQAEYLTGVLGVPPVLLIDDVMGELDVNRRAGLLPLLERSHHAMGQVFMTCTEENWPRELSRDLNKWEVNSGSLRAI